MNPSAEELIGWALSNQFDAIRQRISIYTMGSISQDASLQNVIDAILLLAQRGDTQGLIYAFQVPIDMNELSGEQITVLTQGNRLKDFNAGDIDWAGVLNSIFTGIGQLTGAGNQPPMLGSGQQQPAPAPEQKSDNTIYWIAGGIGLLILILILVIALRPRSK